MDDVPKVSRLVERLMQRPVSVEQSRLTDEKPIAFFPV